MPRERRWDDQEQANHRGVLSCVMAPPNSRAPDNFAVVLIHTEALMEALSREKLFKPQ